MPTYTAYQEATVVLRRSCVVVVSDPDNAFEEGKRALEALPWSTENIDRVEASSTEVERVKD